MEGTVGITHSNRPCRSPNQRPAQLNNSHLVQLTRTSHKIFPSICWCRCFHSLGNSNWFPKTDPCCWTYHLTCKRLSWQQMELTSGVSAVILPSGFFLSVSAYSFHKACNMPTTTNHRSAKSLVSACLIGTERGTRDQKVAGSSPDRSAEEISFPESTFCASSYFSIRSAPVLPQ